MPSGASLGWEESASSMTRLPFDWIFLIFHILSLGPNPDPGDFGTHLG